MHTEHSGARGKDSGRLRRRGGLLARSRGLFAKVKPDGVVSGREAWVGHLAIGVYPLSRRIRGAALNSAALTEVRYASVS